VLSRDPDVELYFNSPGVSRRHASLRIDGTRVILEDLGSKNGTYLQGRRVDSPTTLEDGDVIRVGSVTLTFRALGRHGTTQTW
jgi:pSer/pThr/pTyr-binding forkhead associated (FHA) protein